MSNSPLQRKMEERKRAARQARAAQGDPYPETDYNHYDPLQGPLKEATTFGVLFAGLMLAGILIVVLVAG